MSWRAGEAQEHDVGVDRRVGQRPVGDRARLLVHHRDLRDDVHRDPARLEQRGDVGVARDLVERLEPVGHAADAAVAVVLGDGAERAVGRLHPEHAARGHAAGAAVGERRRASARRTARRRRRGASEKVIASGAASRCRVVGEVGGEGRPVGGGHGRQLTDGVRAAIRRRSGNASTNASTSASVDDQPTLTRSERSASTPIAASTGDGSSVSLEHDEPECTATPCWSSASRIGSASTPSMPRHTRWGRQSAGSPKRSTPGTRATASPRQPLGERALAAARRRRRASVAAAPKPTMAGTSSMPPAAPAPARRRR